MQYRVIKEQSLLRRRLIWAAAIAASASAGGAGFWAGVSVAQTQIQQNGSLRDEVRELSNQNSILQSRLTDSELIIDTQNHTSIALRDELTQLHKVNAGLETELGFFRKIMVPGETDQGIHVERLSVSALDRFHVCNRSHPNPGSRAPNDSQWVRQTRDSGHAKWRGSKTLHG